MIKDSKIKDLLIELYQMKTKFLDGEKSVINENEPEKATTVTSVNVKPKNINYGNPQLTTFVSCIDGLEYVSPNVVVTHEKVTKNKDEWFGYEKKLRELGKYNDISACEFQAKLKTIQKKEGDQFLPVTARPKYDENTLIDEQNKYITECLNMMYQLYNNLPEYCAFSYKVTSIIENPLRNFTPLNNPLFKNDSNEFEPIKTEYKIRYAYTNWFTTDYAKWQQNHSYITRDPYLVKQDASYYISKGDEAKYQKVSVKDTLGNISLSGESEIVGGNKFNKLDVLPLTNDEKSRMEKNNPFTYTGDLKLGDGTYICSKEDAPYVNLRTGPGINMDKGMQDPYDNSIAWVSDKIIGKFTGKRVILWLPLFEKERVGETSTTSWKPIKELQSQKKFWKKLGINKESYREPFETMGKPNLEKLINSSEVINEGIIMDIWNTIRSFWENIGSGKSTQLYGIPQDKTISDDSIMKIAKETGVCSEWIEVELLNEVVDATEYTTEKYKKAWVSKQTTEACKTEKDALTGKNEITNTSYGLESLKGYPIKGFKDPVQTPKKTKIKATDISTNPTRFIP